MKLSPVLMAITAMLATGGFSGTLFAKDYTLAMPGDRDWSDVAALWTPSGTPGASDKVLDINGTATRTLFLNGDRTFGALEKSSTGNIRISNGTRQVVTQTSNTLAVATTIKVKNGAYLFRSRADMSTWLTVTASDLVIGDVAQGTYGAVAIADSLEDYARVNFTIEHTTTITGQGGVTIGVPVAGTNVSLGHVSFTNNGTLSAFLRLGVSATTPHTVFVKSLRSEAATSSNVNIFGGAILELSGDEGDSFEPAGEAAFWGLVGDSTHVKKAGSNTQIFARAAGNSYSGGTAISSGVLAIRNTSGSGLGSGSVVIDGSGALAGNGIAALGNGESITVKTGGSIAPSADGTGPQTLRLSGSASGTAPILTMEDGAKFTFSLGSGQNDQVAFLYYAAGDLKLGDLRSIAVNLTGTLQPGVYQLFSFKSGDAASGLVSSGLAGGLVTGTGFDGFTGTFHYDDASFGGTGVISLEVAAVPEPGTVALLVGGLGLLLACRRKQAV